MKSACESAASTVNAFIAGALSRAPEPVADVRRPLTVCRKRLWHEIILFIVFLSAVFRAKFVNDKAPGLQPSCSGHGALWMSK